MQVTDNVNHPAHYNTGQYETIDVIDDWGLDTDHYLATVIKYISRHKHKGASLQDLQKARWYLDRKIRRMEADYDGVV